MFGDSAGRKSASKTPYRTFQDFYFPVVGCITFFVIGGVLLALKVGVPAARMFTARNWVRSECAIRTSYVESQRGLHGAYRVRIAFHYVFNGRAYVSENYDLFDRDFVGGSGHPGKEHEIISRFPAGSTATCFVNPSDPSEAVISRGVPSFAWTAAGISGGFMAISSVILWSVFRNERKARETDVPA